jgi:hypothetical protein
VEEMLAFRDDSITDFVSEEWLRQSFILIESGHGMMGIPGKGG